MTTGRINQVTIFEKPSPECIGPARSTRGSELVHRRGCGTPGRAPSPRTKSGAKRGGHPFATTEFSRSRSAEATVSTALRHTLPRRRLPTASHIKKTVTSTRACPQIRQSIDGHRPVTHRILRRGTVSGDRADFGRLTSPRRKVSVLTRQPAAKASKAATQRLPKWTALTQYQAKGDNRLVMRFRTEGETQPVPTATIRRLRRIALLVKALTAAQVLTTSQVRRGLNPSLPARFPQPCREINLKPQGHSPPTNWVLSIPSALPPSAFPLQLASTPSNID
jgi:hypothetical protein